MAGYLFIGVVVLLIILVWIRERKNLKRVWLRQSLIQQKSELTPYFLCKISSGYDVLYTKKLARHKKDICVQPFHGATWLYSTKDPGSSMENVVIATNDPELLESHPELGTNEIFNKFVTL
jgi:hypothetical protein